MRPLDMSILHQGNILLDGNGAGSGNSTRSTSPNVHYAGRPLLPPIALLSHSEGASSHQSHNGMAVHSLNVLPSAMSSTGRGHQMPPAYLQSSVAAQYPVFTGPGYPQSAPATHSVFGDSIDRYHVQHADQVLPNDLSLSDVHRSPTYSATQLGSPNRSPTSDHTIGGSPHRRTLPHPLTISTNLMGPNGYGGPLADTLVQHHHANAKRIFIPPHGQTKQSLPSMPMPIPGLHQEAGPMTGESSSAPALTGNSTETFSTHQPPTPALTPAAGSDEYNRSEKSSLNDNVETEQRMDSYGQPPSTAPLPYRHGSFDDGVSLAEHPYSAHPASTSQRYYTEQAAVAASGSVQSAVAQAQAEYQQYLLATRSGHSLQCDSPGILDHPTPQLPAPGGPWSTAYPPAGQVRHAGSSAYPYAPNVGRVTGSGEIKLQAKSYTELIVFQFIRSRRNGNESRRRGKINRSCIRSNQFCIETLVPPVATTRIWRVHPLDSQRQSLHIIP